MQIEDRLRRVWYALFVLGVFLLIGACANPTSAGEDGTEPGTGGGNPTEEDGQGEGDAEDPGPPPVPTFVSTWDTGTSATVTLPIYNGGTYGFVVDWGDGNSGEVTAWDDPDASHTYDDPGEYEISITGTIDGWSFNFAFGLGEASDEAVKILEVSSWGPLAFGDSYGHFQDAENLVITATDSPDLSGTDSLWVSFLNCSSLTVVPNMGTWDTSGIQRTDSAFQGATSFNTDIGDWDTSSMIRMDSMFREASSFDQDLGGWDITSLVRAPNLFLQAGLSQTNYDALLIGWESQDTNDSVSFHGGSARYSAGAAAEARQRLIDDHSWTINDGGQAD